MNARYQDPVRGQFISEDPSFEDLGTPNLSSDVQESTLQSSPNYAGLSNFMELPQDQNARDLTLTLSDPQSLNSYSYVENNPLKNVDPNGRTSAAAYLYQQSSGNSLLVVPLVTPEAAAEGIAAGIQYATTKAILLVSGGIQGVLSQITSDQFQNKQSDPKNIIKTGAISAITNAQTEGYGLFKKVAGVALADYLSKSTSGALRLSETWAMIHLARPLHTVS
jgi:hypothetical protein